MNARRKIVAFSGDDKNAASLKATRRGLQPLRNFQIRNILHAGCLARNNIGHA